MLAYAPHPSDLICVHGRMCCSISGNKVLASLVATSTNSHLPDSRSMAPNNQWPSCHCPRWYFLWKYFDSSISNNTMTVYIEATKFLWVCHCSTHKFCGKIIPIYHCLVWVGRSSWFTNFSGILAHQQYIRHKNIRSYSFPDMHHTTIGLQSISDVLTIAQWPDHHESHDPNQTDSNLPLKWLDHVTVCQLYSLELVASPP